MDIYDPSLTVGDLAQGYAQQKGKWICLICVAEFEQGIIYTIGDTQYEAFRAVAEHVRASHGSVFLHLMRTQTKYTGLTQHQADVLAMMMAGHSDREIAERTAGTANTASIRNLRFQLKEREKQAKAFLALMEASRRERPEKPGRQADARQAMQGGARLDDGRFDSSEKERAAVLKFYFSSDGVLKEFPVREKRKIIVLGEIARRFEAGRAYTEKEVNAIIAYPDYASIRRYLIEYGFMARSQDCGEYRLKERDKDANTKLPE